MALPELYEECEEEGVEYFIRLKANSILDKLADEEVKKIELSNYEYQVRYSEFIYKAGEWDRFRRVILKVEKKEWEHTKIRLCKHRMKF